MEDEKTGKVDIPTCRNRRRRRRVAQDQNQENVHVIPNVFVLPTKNRTATMRGPLEDLSNAKAQPVVAAAKIEKKPFLSFSKRYCHVQAKVNTGLARKNAIQPSLLRSPPRPPPRTPLRTPIQPSLLRTPPRTPLRTPIQPSLLRTPPRTPLRTPPRTPLRTRMRTPLRTPIQPSLLRTPPRTPLRTPMRTPIQPSLLRTPPRTPMRTPIKPSLLRTPPRTPLRTPMRTPRRLQESTDQAGPSQGGEACEVVNTISVVQELEVYYRKKRGQKNNQTASNKKPKIPELPADVVDIDAGDANPLSIYNKYIFKHLKELEVKFKIEQDHMKNQTEINPAMRQNLLIWLLQVHKCFQLSNETFQLTVGIIDQFLQVVPTVKRERLQLYGVAALFIASKYEELQMPYISQYVAVTEYSKKRLLKCEWEMLNKLGCCLARPTHAVFLYRYMIAAHGMRMNEHLANYFIEVSQVEYAMASHKPSELSAAAFCLALHLQSLEMLKDVWTPSLQYYSSYTLEHIEPIVRQIATIVYYIKDSPSMSIYLKYRTSSFDRVSKVPRERHELLLELVGIPSNPGPSRNDD